MIIGAAIAHRNYEVLSNLCALILMWAAMLAWFRGHRLAIVKGVVYYKAPFKRLIHVNLDDIESIEIVTSLKRAILDEKHHSRVIVNLRGNPENNSFDVNVKVFGPPIGLFMEAVRSHISKRSGNPTGELSVGAQSGVRVQKPASDQ
jgi:hypothetical protein